MGALTAIKPTTMPVWLSPVQVAEHVPGLTVENLKQLRKTGKGPAFHKPTGSHGKVTLYRLDDVDAWVAGARTATREQS